MLFRQEPATQQTMKRTWIKAITNESFSKPMMPETKKHKTSSDITEKPSLVQESVVVQLPPAKETQRGERHKGNDMEENKSTAPSVDEGVAQILNSSDKENNSLQNESESLKEQVNHMLGKSRVFGTEFCLSW